MKKLILVCVVALALSLSGCEAIFGAAETPTPLATYTPAPTYTSLPTYTPFPSPTEPPLPTPTLVALESPTPSVFGVTPTIDSGLSGTGLQATLAVFSYIHECPALTCKNLTHGEAGETLLILGRDHEGNWLKVRNSAGQEGWVYIFQFSSPGPDVRQINEITDIPTPSVTVTLRPGLQVSKTSSPSLSVTGSPQAPPLATAGSSSEIDFHLLPGGAQTCVLVNPWYIGQQIQLTDPAVGLPVFKVSDVSQVNKYVYQLDTTGVQSGISVSIQGNVLGNSCNVYNQCTLVTFTICATASSSVPLGKYNNPVVLRIGLGGTPTFDYTISSGVPTVFNVGP